MKKLIPLFALASLALTACTENSTSGAPTLDNGLITQPNPLAVVQDDGQNNAPQTPGGTTAIQIAGQTPGQNPTPTLTPDIPTLIPSAPDVSVVPGSQTDNSLESALSNGTSAVNSTGYWACDEQTEAGTTNIAFYADGNGLLSDATGSVAMSWAYDGFAMDLTIANEFYAQLTNVELAESRQAFSADYVLYEGTTGVLSCVLNADTTQTNIPDTGSELPAQPSSAGGQTLLINSLSGGEAQDVWLCSTSDNSELVLFFLADGSGALVNNNDYPEGIVFEWSIDTQDLVMTLSDGNQVQIDSPNIEQGVFSSDTVLINGSFTESIACELVLAS
jgi:hypothetical protein